MHHICNFVRICFNKNKNTISKIGKTLKNIKNTFLNFYKNIKMFFASMDRDEFYLPICYDDNSAKMLLNKISICGYITNA